MLIRALQDIRIHIIWCVLNEIYTRKEQEGTKGTEPSASRPLQSEQQLKLLVSENKAEQWLSELQTLRTTASSCPRIWNQIHGWRCVLRNMFSIIIARMHIGAFMCVYVFVSMYVPMYVCRCVCTPEASCFWAFQEPPGQLGFLGCTVGIQASLDVSQPCSLPP